MKKYLFTLFLACSTFIHTYAQSTNGIDMASGLRSSGKIYVVVLGLLLIFCLFIFYLFTIDRKIGKLEKRIKEEK